MNVYYFTPFFRQASADVRGHSPQAFAGVRLILICVSALVSAFSGCVGRALSEDTLWQPAAGFVTARPVARRHPQVARYTYVSPPPAARSLVAWLASGKTPPHKSSPLLFRQDSFACRNSAVSRRPTRITATRRCSFAFSAGGPLKSMIIFHSNPGINFRSIRRSAPSP